jgi:hypothetical protein
VLSGIYVLMAMIPYYMYYYFASLANWFCIAYLAVSAVVVMGHRMDKAGRAAAAGVERL